MSLIKNNIKIEQNPFVFYLKIGTKKQRGMK